MAKKARKTGSAKDKRKAASARKTGARKARVRDLSPRTGDLAGGGFGGGGMSGFAGGIVKKTP